MKNLLNILLEYKDDVTCVDRVGNLITVYFPNEIKVSITCKSVSSAIKMYRKYREQLEDIKVG